MRHWITAVLLVLAVRAAAAQTTFSTLYSFQGGDDGSSPAALVIGLDGAVYGVTASGGPYPCGEFAHCGTVFSLKQSGAGTWVETRLHDFDVDSGDGYEPASVIAGASGELYGNEGEHANPILLFHAERPSYTI
jgi:hypothetical protein